MNDPDRKPSPWDDVVRYVTTNPDNLTVAQLMDKLGCTRNNVTQWRKEGLESGIKPGKGVRANVRKGRARRDPQYIDDDLRARIRRDTRPADVVARVHGVAVSTVYKIRGGTRDDH